MGAGSLTKYLLVIIFASCEAGQVAIRLLDVFVPPPSMRSVNTLAYVAYNEDTGTHEVREGE
jgi:ABC-type lipopolysaccharide export system ATPase subunit